MLAQTALLLSSLALSCLATNCEYQPISLPLKDIQIASNISDSFMKGIPATIGTPEQNIALLPWVDLNNTYLYDEDVPCDPTVVYSETMCLVRRGNFYLEADSTSFTQYTSMVSAGAATQETDDTGEESGVSDLISSSLGGTDNINFASTGALDRFPIGIPRQAWDHGYTTMHALGLGPNSTYLNALVKAGRIGARAFSIYWGRMWTDNNPIDGSVIIGGYDQKKIIGSNYTQPLDYSLTGCWTGMKVTVNDIRINYRDGSDQTIFSANQQLGVCIVPQRQLLMEVPGTVLGNFQNFTNTQTTGPSFDLSWGSAVFNATNVFDGDITIYLSSGLSVRVANDQYIIPSVSTDRNGSRIFNDSARDVLIGVVDNQPATLGRYFLTAAYLTIDHDAGTFSLWQANPTTSSYLTPVTNAQTATSACLTNSNTSSTTAKADDKQTHTISPGAIAGAVIGSVVVLSVIVAIVMLLLGRHRRRGLPSLPPKDEHSDFKELPVTGSATSSAAFINVSRRQAELHQTPKMYSEMDGWDPHQSNGTVGATVYEMGSDSTTPRTPLMGGTGVS